MKGSVGLLIAVAIVIASFMVADFVAKYTISLGPFPLLQPYAFLGSIIQGFGILVAILLVLFVLVRRGKT